MVCKTCKLLKDGRCTDLGLPVGNLDPACTKYVGPIYEGRHKMDDDLNHGVVTDNDEYEDEDWNYDDDWEEEEDYDDEEEELDDDGYDEDWEEDE
jgi:hypothetical protein